MIRQATQHLTKAVTRLDAMALLADGLLLTLSLFLAFGLVSHQPTPWAGSYFTLFKSLGLIAATQLAILLLLRVQDIVWKYMSTEDLPRLVGSITLAILATFPLISSLFPEQAWLIPFQALDLFFSIGFLGGVRVLVRIHAKKRNKRQGQAAITNVLIFGAGKLGAQTASRLAFQEVGSRQNVIGFVDDDPQKLRHLIAGVRVLGNREKLPFLLQVHKVNVVLVAVAHVNSETLSTLLAICQKNRIRLKKVVPFEAHLNQEVTFEPFKEIQLEDLLDRPEISINLNSIKSMLAGKRVMVTGAGGSIGSELCRQIANFDPQQLILLDHSEYQLYKTHQELETTGSAKLHLIPLLMDLKDGATVTKTVKELRPEIVFHAAAYKHVHLVEANACAGILNNVLGCANLLSACRAANVDRFVLISSDKAVNPRGVMGATKRVCELMALNEARETGRRYCAVRFGNVLGSSGSLIPLLQNQIRAGMPVTITHPAMSRYFMLIHEAVGLVLKSASISRHGEINILRMGAPIKIVDIAKRLILLLGRSEIETPIVYTGMRPGEKLHEELYLTGQELNTEHPDILVLEDAPKRIEDEIHLKEQVARIVRLAQSGSLEAVTLLYELISQAAPSKKVPDTTTTTWEIPPLQKNGLTLPKGNS